MLASYYKTAIRQISRSRFHSLLNIIGLSVGIAFTLLVAVYAWSEWDVNRGLKNYSCQYILTSEWKDPNLGYPLATLGPLAKALKENYPSLVANYYRFDGVTVIVANGEKEFREELQMGDSTFLPMYGFDLLWGDPRTALDRPFTVVITDDRAIKFFGTTDVVGRNLTIANNSGQRRLFRITGVLKKPALNSVTRLTSDNTIFVSSANLDWFGRNMRWDNDHIAGYLELQPGVKPQNLDGPMRHLIETNANPVFASNLTARAERLTDYYLKANGGVVEKMIFTISFIAVFILGMAMVNFVNLSISRSGVRMKEIGIRKVLGGLHRQLLGQFLAESILLSLLSTAIALLIYGLMSAPASNMLNREMPGLFALPPLTWVLIVLFGVTTGCVACLYPAFLLSSVPTINVLRGKAAEVGRHGQLLKGLVGFQFGTALIVFAGAIIISQQVQLFFSGRLGYNKEFILTVQLPRDWSAPGVQRMERSRSIFASMPQVSDATLSFEIPDGANSGSLNIVREGGDPSRPVVAQSLVSDAHFASTYGIPMAAGVFFQSDRDGRLLDSTRVVLNEAAARSLGWKKASDAVGQRVQVTGINGLSTVSGVVKDFHFDAMGSAIPPEVFYTVNTWNIYRYFSFKLKPGNMAADIAALQHEWSLLMPGAPFEYRFMDDALRTVYDSELRLRKAASTATVLSFIIVLLGVIGLVSGSVRRRTREMAIRKVIGANASSIIRLFLREYLPVLAFAALIAAPVTGWIMHRWLDNYATRISITVWPFVLAISTLALVIITLIVFLSLTTALANPTRNLRAD